MEDRDQLPVMFSPHDFPFRVGDHGIHSQLFTKATSLFRGEQRAAAEDIFTGGKIYTRTHIERDTQRERERIQFIGPAIR